GHERLITRTKDSFDGSTPSGNSMAATGLLKLAALTGRSDFRDRAEQTLTSFAGLMAQSPTGAGQLLAALDFHRGPVKDVAATGRQDGDPRNRVIRAAGERLLPNVVVAAHDPATGEAPGELIPLLRDRPARGEVTTYVCQNFACLAPAIGAEAGE